MNDPILARSMSWQMARMGGVLRSLLMVVCGVVGLGAAALLLEPQALMAVARPPQPTTNSQRAHDEFAATLASLINDGVEVLAITNHSPESAASIVVWMNDSDNLGVIDPSEIAVISHSQLLRTVTVYTLDKHGSKSAETASGGSPQSPLTGLQSQVSGAQPSGSRPVRLSGPLDRIAVSAPVFCERWRATPSVQPRAIATGLSDMRVESTGEQESGSHVLRLRLRWSPDSADGAGEAVALFRSAAPAP